MNKDNSSEGAAIEKMQATINHAMRKAAASSGLTQREIAQRLGVTERSVNRLLSKKANFRLETIAAFFHAVGFQLDVDVTRVEVLAVLIYRDDCLNCGERLYILGNSKEVVHKNGSHKC